VLQTPGLFLGEVHLSNILETLRKLQGQTVTIGIHGSEGEQKKIIRTISAQADLKEVKRTLKSAGIKIAGKLERHRVDQNLTVAQVASWNEFGNKRIPQRSFIRDTFRINKDNIVKFTKKVLKNNPSDFYDLTGQYVLGLIQKRISSKSFKGNSEATKKWKGSDTPLVDFGQLRNAITYDVVNK